MIVAKTPLRVSLAGGSTDNPAFVKENGYGKVISFTPNLYTYCSLHQDVNGFNNHDGKYIISYSRQEVVSRVSEIKNDIVRSCLFGFQPSHTKVSLSSDIFSAGSGLASSSSYIISLLASLLTLNGVTVKKERLTRLAYNIESKLNSRVGYQDVYGCCLGGLKELLFKTEADGSIYVTNSTLPSDWLFNCFDFYLLYTGVGRNSKKVLSTYKTDESKIFLEDVEDMSTSLKLESENIFLEILNRGWENKKKLSAKILNKRMRRMDNQLSENQKVLAHRLCGAGSGGYFLVVTSKGKKVDFPQKYIKINLDTKGFQVSKI